MDRIEIDIFAKMHFYSNLEIFKDNLFFKEARANLNENNYQSRLSCLNLNNNEVIPITIWQENFNYFKLDNELILTKQEDEKNYFIYLDPFNFKEIKKIKVPFIPDKVEKINDELLVFTTSISRHDADAYLKTQGQRQEDKEKEKTNEDYEIYDEYPFVYNGVGCINNKREALFIYNLKNNELKRISKANYDVRSFSIMDHCIYYAIADYQEVLELDCQKLLCYDLDSDNSEILIEKGFSFSDIFFLNKQLFIRGNEIKASLKDEDRFYIYNDHKLNLCLDNELTFYNAVSCDVILNHGKDHFIKDNKYYILANNKEYVALYSFNGKMIKAEIQIDGTVNEAIQYHDSYIIQACYKQKLPTLYQYRDGQLKSLLDFNEKILENKYIAEPERVELLQDPVIDGFILKPIDFDENKKYPAILDIHGGPKGAYGTVFMHECQYWASQGYFVFFCNPRGSSGKGNKFADLTNNWGNIDYQDIMNSTYKVLDIYPNIDQNRLGITGGSYGGYMTNWIIGHTDLFKAACSQRSISNMLTEVLVSDYGLDLIFSNDFKDPHNCASELWDISPLKYANNVKTPLLFIHSDRDYRCPLEEAVQYYTALKLRKIPTKLVIFKGENHELSRSGKPLHRLKRLNEITTWMDKYLKEEKHD